MERDYRKEEEKMEKKKKKYSRTDKANPWNWIHDSWTVCTFYCDSNYICSACILYGSYCFE